MSVPPQTWATRVPITALLLVAGVMALGCKPQATTPPAEDTSASRGASVSDGRADEVTQSSPGPEETSSAAPPTSPPEPPRETLFDGWPTPKLALFITGQQHGYIEPCGCTGLANQKGGLARRHALELQLVDKGWTVLAVDAGNQVRRLGPQAELKFQLTVSALQKMGYQAAGLGVDDLRLPVGALLATTMNDASPFVSANASLLSMTPNLRVTEVSGMKLGFVSVLGTETQAEIRADEITKSLPDDAIEQLLPQLDDAQCEINVLLIHGSVEEARRLGNKYAKFGIVVAAGGDDPLYQPETIDSGALFMQTGVKSKYVLVVGLFEDPEQRFRYQRVPLDGRFPDSPAMMDLFSAYQEQLKTMGLSELGLKPIPHPSGARFVGSERCSECHVSAFEKWITTPHSRATEALSEPSERSEIPRHFDPECLSCHVTGWHPQRYFPYTSGYLSLQESAHLRGNGCENCHGPGSRHVAVQSGELDLPEAEIKKVNEAMLLPLTSAEQKCVQCHDLDNDPDFQEPGAFSEYWELIKHGLDPD